MLRSLSWCVGVLIIFVLGAILYTWPASTAIWEARTDVFMSDGTDQTTAPFQFDLVHQAYLNNPSLFLYGAFPNSRMDAPEGMVSWFSVAEKIAGAIFPFFTPIEQVGVLLALVLLVANGLAFYGMSRSLGWNRMLSLALSIAWAFSAYTRARVQVHVGLAGVYIVPMAIWGIRILQMDRSKRGIIKASLCFIVCATVNHYYLIFMVMFSPFLAMFYFSSRGVRESLVKATLAVFMALTPAMLFLAMAFLKPVPSDFQLHVSNVLPITGKSEVWPHPFLTVYSANLEDYFSGDIAIGANDINSIRGSMTEDIRKDMRIGNFHEHAHGIRWVIWLAFVFSLAFALSKRRQFFKGGDEEVFLLVFLAFGFFSFLVSLPPDWGFIWGPSAWIHRAVEQVRVPNRAGIFVHFCILVIVGVALQTWFLKSKMSERIRNILMGVFLLVVIFDFPPFMNSMPMAQTIPSRASLIGQKPGHCGLGFHFPYTSGAQDSLRYYYLLQSFRGTDCSILNASAVSQRDFRLSQLLGYGNKNLMKQVMENEKSAQDQLIRFARCNKLDWLVFDPRVSEVFVQEVCAR
jgi:hypothetical protein